jgi:hypothetical protein
VYTYIHIDMYVNVCMYTYIIYIYVNIGGACHGAGVARVT